MDDRSSVYCTESDIRKQGSFIYEDFMATDGTDVKVYAIGPHYAHAEARKSPGSSAISWLTSALPAERFFIVGLDGKVDRDADGKEIRYPVILSNYEKHIARKIVLAFRVVFLGWDRVWDRIRTTHTHAGPCDRQV